ncbi:MAG: DUF3558 domain-containing protein [Syntrophobacteraceae bacterium]|jgi:hypothetical protein|nr:DUF3558 domain-containing protein [Syntrophobacteraceae bacterium]
MKAKSIVLILTFSISICILWSVNGMGGSDPCALLSTAEAEELLGEPINAPEPTDTGNPLGQKLCSYSASSSNRFIHISILRTEEMSKKVRDHGQSAPSVYRTTREMLDPVRAVPGVGDDACWGIPGLHILKGSAYLVIGVGNTDKIENLELAKRVAAKVLGRL